MTRPAEIRHFFEFGPFRFDPGDCSLVRDDERIQLTPKAGETLRVLLESGGRVVGKQELMERVWPDAHVEENNLAQNISNLRKIIGDDARGRPYIETIPRRGYRLTVGARIASPSAPPEIGLELPPAAEQRTEPSPKVRYARSGEVNIAYQVVGDGPIDLVFVMGWVSHLDYFWREPSFASFLRRLASFSRLILFDKRGTGLSDRVPLHQLPTLEERMDDVRAVMEAVGSKRAVLCGVSEGGPMCSLFAATYPERTIALIMIGSYAKRIRSDDYPWGPTAEERETFFRYIEEHWGEPVGIEERAPSRAADAAFREWWGTYLRMGASPGAAVALTKMNADIDIRHVLPSIRVPTLVIHRSDDACLKVEEGRYLAARIPGARFVELPGDDHLPFVGDQTAILSEVEHFLGDIRHALEFDRVLATVLFTQAGTPHPPESIEELDRFASSEIEWRRGQKVGSIGEGLLATFDGPARAIRCAVAIRDRAKAHGVELSCALHTGECEVASGRLSGLVIDLGAEISELARDAQIIVSSTVRDLVAGSGIAFRELPGRTVCSEAGEWNVFTVEG